MRIGQGAWRRNNPSRVPRQLEAGGKEQVSGAGFRPGRAGFFAALRMTAAGGGRRRSGPAGQSEILRFAQNDSGALRMTVGGAGFRSMPGIDFVSQST